MPGERGGSIAYLMSRFPHLPETFILREMVEMERQGWRVGLYPLIVQQQEVIHTEAESWLHRADKQGLVSGPALSESMQRVVKEPLRTLRLAIRTLVENGTSPDVLARTALLWPRAVYLARRMRADAVTHIHAHFATYPAFAAWLIHNLTGIPYSVTVHAHDIYVRRQMLATKLRAASFIVAISSFNRDYLAEKVGGWAAEKTYVVHCGIEPERYRRRANELSSPGSRFEILNVGSLQPYKGQIYLIRACALLRDRGLNFRCRIIGGGEEAQRLKMEIQQLDLGSRVELLGPQTQEKVAELLSTADCYVQPSIITPSGKMEGLPVALMEALASELPVVATEISGVPELVQDGRTGYLVPPADPERLAERLFAVSAGSHEAARLARTGRELVLKEFDLRKNVAQLGSLFQRFGGVQTKPSPEPDRAAPLILTDK